MPRSLRLLCRLWLFIALLGVCITPAMAEMRTLTDQQGRTLQADIVSVDGNQVTIRRDDGQTFTLSLSSLSEADQKALKEWAAKQATTLAPNTLELKLSRGMFGSVKTSQNAVSSNGDFIKNAATITQEKWGYGITLINHSISSVSNLHADYILFVKIDKQPGKDSTPAPLKRKKGSNTVDFIKAKDSVTFRTTTITAIKQQLHGDTVWVDTGNNAPMQDKLYGIWVRIYAGDQLVCEACYPESLSKTEKWDSSSK